MSRLIRVLSIDGGGIRGIIPAQVVNKLEQILKDITKNPNAHIADYFDFMAGTSTGGILSCIYLAPDKSNSSRPKFTAKDAVNFYVAHGPEIFKRSWQYKLLSMFGVFTRKYGSFALDKCLKKYFGNLKLSQMLKPCLITSYNIEERYEHFFTRHDALKNLDYDFYVKDVAKATSSAPTYFEAAGISSLAIKFFPLIDGGVFANNPALCAYTEVCKEYRDYKASKGLKTYPSAKDMMILSLGTGEDIAPICYDKARKWGLAQWAIPIIDLLMSGSSSTVNSQLNTIFSAIDRPEQYLRINPIIPDHMSKLDDASPENINNLLLKGQEVADQYEEKLRLFAYELIQNRYREERFIIA